MAAALPGELSTVTVTPAVSVDARQRDGVWAALMLPVLEQRAEHAKQGLLPNSAERQGLDRALRKYRDAVAKAHIDGRLPEQSVVERMLNAGPEQERDWQRWSKEQAERALTHGTDRAEQWLQRVLYLEFPLWAGALERTPDAMRPEDFLPLVRAVFGEAVSAVTERHLTELRGHVNTLLAESAAVTRAALIRREQFAVLRSELGMDRASPVTSDSQATDQPTVGGAEGRLLQWLDRNHAGLSPDRKLEIRGVFREMPTGTILEPAADAAMSDPAAKVKVQAEAEAKANADVAILVHAVELAYRRYTKQNDGVTPNRPLRWDDLEQLLGDGTPLTWQRLETVATEAQARQQWRDRKQVAALARRGFDKHVVRIPGVQSSGRYQSMLERQRRRDLKQPGQPDSPAARQAEADLLWRTAYPAATPETSATSAARVSTPESAPESAQASTATPAPLTRANFERLVRVRRKFFTERGDRRFTDLSDYRPMTLELLGSSRTAGADELVRMAVLVRDAEAELAKDLTKPGSLIDQRSLREVLAELVIAKWHEGNPSTRPMPPGMAADVDHSRLVSSFHAIGELPFVPELTDWLNGIIPAANRPIDATDVRRKLMSLFGQGLDDGFNIPIDSKRYDVRLWPVSTDPPKVAPGSLLGAKEVGSTRRSAKLENRAYRYRDLAVSQTETSSFSWDLGPAYRAELGIPETVASTRFDVSGTYGQSGSTDQRSQAGTAISDYQQLRIKEPVGDAQLPVVWVARVEDRQTLRWQGFFFEEPAGGLRRDTVTYAVAQFQLPYTATEARSQPGTDPDYLREIQVTSAEQFPLWRMDFAASRVQLADNALAGLRAKLSPADYAFWKQVAEAYLTNDQVMMGLKNILRPRNEQNYQQVFRQTLERDGRFLSFSLTSGAQEQPINKIMKISEVSRSGETRFDWVNAVVRKVLRSANRARGHRATLIGAVRLLKRVFRLGGSGRYTWRRALQEIRHHRAWLTRAQRVVGTLQYVLADFTVQLDVDHRGGDGQVDRDPVAIAGYAHLMMHSADLRELARPNARNATPLQWSEATVPAHQQADAAEDAKLAEDAKPDDTKIWWNLDGFGLTMDFPEGFDGVPQLYDSIVPTLVTAGYLPKAAVPGDVTPWEHLQKLSPTGADTNLAGQEYANWRMLLSQLSEEALRALSDDVLGAEAGQPGVPLVFPHPDRPEDPEQRLVVGLWAELAADDSTHQGVTKYQIQYGHTSIDTMTIKRATGKVWDLSGYGAADLLPVDGNVLGQYGRQGSGSKTDKLGRTQSTAVTSDTDGQKMPSSRYTKRLHWRWFAERGDIRLAKDALPGAVTLLQPDALHDTKGQVPLPPFEPDLGKSSVLERMISAIYTAIGTKGVGHMQKRLIEAAVPGLSKVDTWQGLTTIVYKTALMRALSASASLPIGGQQVDLVTRPVGRPQIVKVWFPYTQQIVESQVGREKGRDKLRQRGWQGQFGGRSDHINLDLSVTRNKGEGEGESSLYTVGSYRAIYQDTKMVIVRTAVINRLTTANGEVISSPGEILVNVPLSEVIANWYEFDNNVLLNEHVTEPLPLPSPASALTRALTTKLDPPVALQDGNFWSAVWPMLFTGDNTQSGFGMLMRQLDRVARKIGGPELATQIKSLPGGLGGYMERLNDGGGSWQFSVGKRRFELVVLAKLAGPARDSRPGATGAKLYERGNKSEDASRNNVSSDGLGAGLLGIGGPVAATLSGALTKRTDQRDTRGSNLLFMNGLRANKLTDFTQAVRYYGYVREVRGVAAKAADKAKTWAGHARPAKEPFEVTPEHVVGVPTEGTLPRGLPAPVFEFQLVNGRMPDTYRILGLSLLQPIYDALVGTQLARLHDPATVTAKPEQGTHGTIEPLTFENRRDFLPSMITDGAPLRWVVTALGALQARNKDLKVRVRFDTLRHLYFMEKAELENYDHGTDLAAHVHNQNTQKSVSGAATVVFPVTMGQSVGLRIAGSKENSKAIGIDQTNWIEHRAWLRNDTSVYFVYSTLGLEIEAPGQPVIHTTGAVELVVDQKGALQLGIPIEVLRSVVPEKQRAKEFGADGKTPVRPLARKSPIALSPPIAEEIGAQYRKVVRALRNAPDHRPGARSRVTGAKRVKQVAAPRLSSVGDPPARPAGALAGSQSTLSVARPMQWYDDVLYDGNCLFDAVPKSAVRQGVALPPGVTGMASLRIYASAEVGRRPGQFADILGRTTGRLVTDELRARGGGGVGAGSYDSRLYPGFRPSPPSNEKRAEWQRTARNNAVYVEARRRKLPIADLSIDALLGRMRDWQPPNLDNAVRNLEQVYNREQVWDEITRLIDDGDAAVLARLKGLTNAGPLVNFVQNLLASTNALPEPEELLVKAMAGPELWDTSIGDDVPAALARILNLNIVVVENGYESPLNPAGQQALYLPRVNGNHYQSGGPGPSDQQLGSGQAPSWDLRLGDGVVAEGNVFVVSSQVRGEPAGLIADLRAGASVDRPVVVLGVAGPGRDALSGDVAGVNV
ncbi:OTU domain-containing protein, partial [Micromonospora polyrhachis]